MKKYIAIIAGIAVVSLMHGCQGAKSRAGEGAVIGGILGAAAGTIIGHQSHHGGEGAGIGAAAGALAGGLVGSQIAKPGSQGQQAPAATQGYSASQMSLQQIIDLSKQGINADVIIDKIRLSNSKFSLSAADIANLQQQGVSQKVIDEMSGANGAALR